MQQPVVKGLHRFGRLWSYTSVGTGYWGPPKRHFRARDHAADPGAGG
jgi:predicted MPP superfamily phosphohydrolase